MLNNGSFYSFIDGDYFVEDVKKSSETISDSHSPDHGLPEHSAHIRVNRELMLATEPYAIESVAKSWWYVASTFTLMIITLVAASVTPWWPLRLFFSILGALLMVRAFITYHDYMHGAI